MLGYKGGLVRGGWQPVLVVVAGCGAGPPDPASGDAVAALTSTAGETAAAPEAQDEWPVVRLDEMAVGRSDSEPERQNPFRFGSLRTSAPQSGLGGNNSPGPVEVGGDPPDRESVPPPLGAASPGGTGTLPLTFIRFVESPAIEGRAVVLTDGELVFHGRVGDVIDGRYRIVGLGLESVDVERVDGQGQQTLRLPSEPSSGS